MNVIFSPRLSLQIYAQPLLASGDYHDFKELAVPRTFDFLHYGYGGSTPALDRATRVYTADPDGAAGAAPPITFDDPDFNFKSLRLNAVFRWELKPGSAFYAVWTRQQQDAPPTPATSPSAVTPARSSPRRATTCFSSRSRTGSAAEDSVRSHQGADAGQRVRRGQRCLGRQSRVSPASSCRCVGFLSPPKHSASAFRSSTGPTFFGSTGEFLKRLGVYRS